MKKNTITIAVSLVIAAILYFGVAPVTAILIVVGSLLFEKIPFLAIIFPFVTYFSIFFLILKFIDFRKRKNKFSKLTAPCKDCEIDTFEIDEYDYIVNDEIWQKIAPEDKHKVDYFLCIGCIEKRLGRQLIEEDFPMNILANSRGKHSERLQERIENK